MALLRAVCVAIGIALFTWLGFEYFPGHTFLQSDTQIYVPMMERLDSPGFLARDIVATRPHLSFTVYDEITLAIRRMARADWEEALRWQQLLFRAGAILGVYLLATSAGATAAYAMLLAALINLGATLLGPAVLTVEYEPIPRGFALALVLLSLGLLAHGKAVLGGLAAALAFLYHPPTAVPFWIVVFAAMTFDRWARRHWRPVLLMFFIACLLLANLAQLQPNVVESQDLFGRLSQRMVDVQHFRTRYTWVSLWARRDIWHYLGIAVAGFWAMSRIWTRIPRQMRWFFLALPVIGLLGVPFSYVTLEKLHLAVVPQYQPARALAYTVVVSEIACGLAAIAAVQARRAGEAFGWFLVVFAMPLNVRWFDLLRPFDTSGWVSIAVWLALAGSTAALAAVLNRRGLRWMVNAAPLAAMWALPAVAHVATYPKVDKIYIAQLASWAKGNTWGSSMFLFPDAGHDLLPGIFRALSERALWVDWKSGGQVNYFQAFADEWYPRFEQTMNGPFSAGRLEGMLSLPIDYYVLKRKHALRAIKPVFTNQEFVVYDAQDLRNASTSLRLGTDD